MPQEAKTLLRAIDRWSLTALMLNTTLGASIFGLPSLLAARLGALSPLGYLVTAVGIGAVAACLAEVASQFRGAGGPYLYARICFGAFAAIQIGWLTWLTRIVSAAAVADLFVSYLIQFFPRAQSSVVRAPILMLLISPLALANYFGVKSGMRLNNFFTIAKAFVVVVFISAGAMALALHPDVRVHPQAISVTRSDWMEAVLLMVASFGGFEAALFASAETSNPRKDVAPALVMTLTTVTFLYVAVQYVVIHTLPTASTTTKPVADAAQHFVGALGASLMAVGALVSVVGSLSANMLHTPRLSFAMGERGDFPNFFAAIHPRFRTPYVSIAAFAVLLFAFAEFGSFRWNSLLVGVSRIIIYASIAVAVPVLRRKQPDAGAFRLPGAIWFVAPALLFTGVLITRIHNGAWAVLAGTSVVGVANWLWTIRKRGKFTNPADHS